MIYRNKDLVLSLGKKAFVYHKNHLLFIGDTKIGMRLFISNSDIKLKDRLAKTTATNPSH